MSIRDSEHYEDSQDMIERIRKLREAAERKMNAFGDPVGYDVRVISGRKGASGTQAQAETYGSAVEDSQ